MTAESARASNSLPSEKKNQVETEYPKQNLYYESESDFIDENEAPQSNRNSPSKNKSTFSKSRLLSLPPTSKTLEREINEISGRTKSISLENNLFGSEHSSTNAQIEQAENSASSISKKDAFNTRAFTEPNNTPEDADYVHAASSLQQYEDSLAEYASLLDQDDAESYFEAFHKVKRKIATSNNTLALLAKMKVESDDIGRDDLSFDDINSKPKGNLFSNSFAQNHKNELERNLEFYRLQYNQWSYELYNGFNLLFYGYGSKKNFLYDFCNQILCDKHNPLIIINGFYPNLDFKAVLENIVLNVLSIPKRKAKTGSILDLVTEIQNYFSFSNSNSSVESLNLLVHNIDGICLRKESIQTGLSLLSSTPSVHLVASIDHTNAPLLWDNSKLFENGYNFIWHNLSTFEDYIEETSFETYQLLHYQKPTKSRCQNIDVSSMVSTTNSSSASNINLLSVQHVMANLTSNAKNIFVKLAEYQINSAESANKPKTSSKSAQFDPDLGMEYFHLYNVCKESFLVSNEITFRSLLTEFKDHKIITFVSEPDGSQILYIPLCINDLKKFVDNE